MISKKNKLFLVEEFSQELLYSMFKLQPIVTVFEKEGFSKLHFDEAFRVIHNVKATAMWMKNKELSSASHKLEEQMIAQEFFNVKQFIEDLKSYITLIEKQIKDLDVKTKMSGIVNIRSNVSKFQKLVESLSLLLEKKIALKIDCDDIYLPIEYWRLIDLSLLHILRNSCDHGVEDKSIRLKTQKSETAKITLKILKLDKDVTIEITDDGKGIDSSVIHSVFDAHFSTANSTTMVSGRGQGLSIVKDNIESLNGYVQLNSQLGQSTTFRLVIPIKNTNLAA